MHRIFIRFNTGFTCSFRLLVAILPGSGNQANTLFLQVLPETTSFTKVIRSLQEGLQRSEANRPSILCGPLKTIIDVCFVARFGESVVCCNYKCQSVNRLILCRETIATHTHTHARTTAVFGRMDNMLKVTRGSTYVNFEGSVHLHRKVELFYCDIFIPYYPSL